MASINFEGTGVALVTPLTSDLQVDFNGLARLLEHTSSLDWRVSNHYRFRTAGNIKIYT